MIAIGVTDTHYLQQNHDMILSSSENSFPKTGVLSSGLSDPSCYSSQELGKRSWQGCREDVAATQPRPGLPGLIGDSPALERWRVTVVPGRSNVGTSCPSLCQLEAESMSQMGLLFPTAHVTASLELERSQRLMGIPFSGTNPQGEGSSDWL